MPESKEDKKDGGPRWWERQWISQQGKRIVTIIAIVAGLLGAGAVGAACTGGHPCCAPYGAGVCNPC